MIIYDSKGAVLLDIEVDDTSVRYKAIKGENSLTLKYSLPEHVEVPIGSYCIFKNEYYYLMSPENITMKHRRDFEYDLVMLSEDSKAKRYMFVNPVDGRLKFSLTAKPSEHLQMFVDNMNARDNGWKVGECPEHTEIVLSYNHTFCHNALVQLADELDLDYWFEYADGEKIVHLGRLEINKNNPLPLSYGGDGQGLKADIKRVNYSDALPVDVLYVQGGEKNIDASKYGSNELHLPKGGVIRFDGTSFEDEDGFDETKARTYAADANGYSISRLDKEDDNHSEDSLDCSEIYPTKEEKVDAVIDVDLEKNFYDILFRSDVDYSKYVIGGEKATIIFQSGMLAGKEFDLATDTNGNLICKKEGEYWRMEIVPQEIDGITMPSRDSGYIPTDVDTFKVFNIQLPDEYVSNDTLKTGAEWDMFRYAVRHMFANEEPQYSITGTLDEIYAKKNWLNIEGRLYVGNYISFSDKSFQAEPMLIRIIGIKEYVNKPHSPIIEFSNQNIGSSLIGTINRVENNEARTEELYRESRNFTKRTFRSAQETLDMLSNAFDDFSTGIDPVTIKTMAALVGDESLQFIFTEGMNSLTDIPCPLAYDASTKRMKGGECALVHMTLGVDDVTVKSSRNISDYKRWHIGSWDSAVLDIEKEAYYVYVKAGFGSTEAEYMLSAEPRKMYDAEYDADNYYFLVGVLNSEAAGTREFVTVYGFTEILPGQITTDIIRSADGQTYFDLANNEIGGVIKFKAGSEGLENIAGEFNFGGQNMLRNTGFTGDYLSKSIADGVVLEEATKLDNDTLVHWETEGDIQTVELEGVSASGSGVYGNGIIEQKLANGIIEGESYVVTFKAAGDFSGEEMYVICAGNNELITLEDSWQKFTVRFVAKYSTDTFALRLSSCTVCELQLERGTLPTSWGNSIYDNASDRTYYESLKYLADALKGSTTIAGGLVLTNTIRLGEESNASEFVERAGSNGLYVDDNSPAFYAGGTLEQADETARKYESDDDDTEGEIPFVVTHGGKMILNNAFIRKGCHIGDSIRVIEGGIELDTKNDDVEGVVRISESGGFQSSNDRLRTAFGGAGCSNLMLEVSTMNAATTCPAKPTPIGVWGDDDGDAILCGSGMFSGLRTSSAYINDLYVAGFGYMIQNTMSNVLFPSSGTYDISLDSLNPTNGQELWLETMGADINVVSTTPMWSHVNGAYETSHTFASRGVIRFKYYGGNIKDGKGVWTYTWVESH